MIINTVKMATTKQCIKKNQPISACANIGRNISTISKKYQLPILKFCNIGSRYFADPIYQYTSTLGTGIFLTTSAKTLCVYIFYMPLQK